MTRVFGAVNWHAISKDDPEAWLYFYELFLQDYDVGCEETGSYYTPPEVVTAMVGLVDEALRSNARFNLRTASPRLASISPIPLSAPARSCSACLGASRRRSTPMRAKERGPRRSSPR